MTNPLVSLFGTYAVTGTGAGVSQDLLFAGADGFGAGVLAQRLVPPPQSGIIRRVILRTISVDDPAISGIDYHVRLFGTRIDPTAAEGNASQAASFIGESLAPLTPTDAILTDLARVDPDLDQVVEWYYNLQSPLVDGGADVGVPATVPGLLVRLDMSAFLLGTVYVIGVGLEIESLQPGFPEAPLFQRGGTASAAAWPQNTTA